MFSDDKEQLVRAEQEHRQVLEIRLPERDKWDENATRLCGGDG